MKFFDGKFPFYSIMDNISSAEFIADIFKQPKHPVFEELLFEIERVMQHPINQNSFKSMAFIERFISQGNDDALAWFFKSVPMAKIAHQFPSDIWFGLKKSDTLKVVQAMNKANVDLTLSDIEKTPLFFGILKSMTFWPLADLKTISASEMNVLLPSNLPWNFVNKYDKSIMHIFIHDHDAETKGNSMDTVLLYLLRNGLDPDFLTNTSPSPEEHTHPLITARKNQDAEERALRWQAAHLKSTLESDPSTSANFAQRNAKPGHRKH